MGLDMYLYFKKEKYTSHFRESGSFYPQNIKDFEEDINIRNFASALQSEKYQVAYWRKANAIHKWFVDNCAEGVDECQEIKVGLAQLIELRDLCKEVMENNSLAKDKLPTQNGFFFGSTKYDDWYFEDIEYTIHIFDKIISFIGNQNDKERYEIVYQASW